MTALLWVAFGGGLGAAARYGVGVWVGHFTSAARFPWATLGVNLLGCLFIGVLGALSVKHDCFSAHMRLFLFTGLLGGFTTFSAFGLETLLLFRRGDSIAAAAYALASVLFGLLAVWLGLKCVELLSR